MNTPENGKKHNVHHIDFVKSNLDPANFIELCDSCHAQTFSGEHEYWIDYYQNVQAIRGISLLGGSI